MVRYLFYTVGDLTYQSPLVYMCVCVCVYVYYHIKTLYLYNILLWGLVFENITSQALLLSLKLLSELYTISSMSLAVRTSSAIAMPPQYHSWINSWTKCTDWKHAGRIPYVDSYTQWKAELFCAYLQKELTHDICVDLKPAAEMKSMQRPGRRWRKKFHATDAV